MISINEITQKIQSAAGDQAASSLIEKTSQAITYGGAGTSVFFGLSADEWAIIGVIGGLVIGSLGLAFQVWFHMKYKRGKK